jgi:uncharacterized protein YjbI with pentapeptide repeats
LNKTDLSETRWKRTYLNRVDVNNQVSPSFVLEDANLSNADFSRSRLIHPTTRQELTMPQAVQLLKSDQNQPELKDALQKIFDKAGHLTDHPPTFIVGDKVANENFVKNVLQIKQRTFEDANKS